MRDFKTEQEVMEYYKETSRKIIIFEGTVYDVDNYMGTHPGGSDFIE